MRNHNPSRQRDGFALPVAILAILVIGAIVTGGFYASSQESRISTSTELGNEAFYVAEYGLERAMGTWNNRLLKAVMDTVDTASFGPLVVRVGGVPVGNYTLHARRLGEFMYLIQSEGRVAAGPRRAVRRVGMTVRTTEARLPFNSAMTVFGGLDVSGTSQIDGSDSGGPGCTPGDSVPGALASSDTLVTTGGASDVYGDPPVAGDSTISPTSLSTYGAIGLQDLIDQATKVYPPGAVADNIWPDSTTNSDGDLICDETNLDNWGNPKGTGVCGDYMPIIYAQGNLDVRVGTGQGILIVEGDLLADGNYDFYGIVIVKGSLNTAGTGNHFEGNVMVMGNGNISTLSTASGNALVQYSLCRVQRAFDANMRPRPLAARSWVDFTANTRG